MLSKFYWYKFSITVYKEESFIDFKEVKIETYVPEEYSPALIDKLKLNKKNTL